MNDNGGGGNDLLDSGFGSKLDEFAVCLLENGAFERPLIDAALVLGAILVTTTMYEVVDIFDFILASVDTFNLIL